MCLNKLVVSLPRDAPPLGLDSLRGVRSTGEAISSDASRSLDTVNNNIYTRIFADYTNQHKFTKKQEVAPGENSVYDTAGLNCSGLFHSVP